MTTKGKVELAMEDGQLKALIMKASGEWYTTQISGATDLAYYTACLLEALGDLLAIETRVEDDVVELSVVTKPDGWQT